MIIWKRRLSFSVNWDSSKRLTIVNFTLSRSASETLSSTTFEGRLPPYVLTVVSQFNVILTKQNVVG